MIILSVFSVKSSESLNINQEALLNFIFQVKKKRIYTFLLNQKTKGACITSKCNLLEVKSIPQTTLRCFL